MQDPSGAIVSIEGRVTATGGSGGTVAILHVAVVGEEGGRLGIVGGRGRLTCGRAAQEIRVYSDESPETIALDVDLDRGIFQVDDRSWSLRDGNVFVLRIGKRMSIDVLQLEESLFDYAEPDRVLSFVKSRAVAVAELEHARL